MKMMKHIALSKIALLALLVPMLAQAHPGHHHHEASFWTGFMHPFTGLDHLLMAISFGVLMWTVSKQWKITGAFGLVIALMLGFVLGAQQWIGVTVAEYGIVASLLVLAVALWRKSSLALAMVATILATFHGVAHGVELGAKGHVMAQIAGMMSAMALLYASGLALGALITKYFPQGNKIVAACAAVVALIGLA
ncbi:HupE/UreJ family protein [Acinetobacter sp. 187]|nr:HupE/UreJ family protein [Acinetobacter lanii]